MIDLFWALRLVFGPLYVGFVAPFARFRPLMSRRRALLVVGWPAACRSNLGMWSPLEDVGDLLKLVEHSTHTYRCTPHLSCPPGALVFPGLLSIRKDTFLTCVLVTYLALRMRVSFLMRLYELKESQ